MDATEIAESELLKALQDALETKEIRPEGALRSEEISEALGIGIKRVRKILRRQVEAGIVEVIQIRWRNLAGQLTLLPAYRLTGKE